MDNAANLFVAEHNHKNASNARTAELEWLVGQLTLELPASKKYRVTSPYLVITSVLSLNNRKSYSCLKVVYALWHCVCQENIVYFFKAPQIVVSLPRSSTGNLYS